jgi:hypothetical protein
LAEIEEAMTFGVHINIDNISILEQFGNKYGNTYPILVRINPIFLPEETIKFQQDISTVNSGFPFTRFVTSKE